MSEKKDDFLNISGDNDFQKRSHSVFDGLGNLEPPKHNEDDGDDDGDRRRPVARGRRKRPARVPDHVLHPGKWTKYSLEEDGSDEFRGLSANDLNKHVARSFIADLKERKTEGTGITGSGLKECGKRSGEIKTSEDKNDDSSRHSFSKQNEKKECEVASSSSGGAQRKAGVVMMPEYVVGKSTAKLKKPDPKQQSLSSDERNKATKPDVDMSHLNDEETVDTRQISDDSSAITASEETLLEDNHGESEENKVTFAKRKQRQRKGLRKHAKTDDDED